jgi:hypothetical protein
MKQWMAVGWLLCLLSDLLLVNGDPIVNIKLLEDSASMLIIVKDGRIYKNAMDGGQVQLSKHANTAILSCRTPKRGKSSVVKHGAQGMVTFRQWMSAVEGEALDGRCWREN